MVAAQRAPCRLRARPLSSPPLRYGASSCCSLFAPHEKADPVIAPRPDAAQAARLAEIEDYEVTNQFSAMGSLKPGLFRAWTLRLILWAIDYTARHVYTRGRLARVHTIHFARWVFIDNGKRLFFASNYDGSLDSYMDDFINKVVFGLNVVFGNGSRLSEHSLAAARWRERRTDVQVLSSPT